MALFSKIKKKLLGSGEELYNEEYTGSEYVEIDTAKDIGRKAKIQVKPFVISDFTDIKDTLDALREGYTIALVNIKPLKDKDLVELKRAINKLKKTTDAINGEIAGFGEDYIVATPSFVEIYRTKETRTVEERPVKGRFGAGAEQAGRDNDVEDY